VADVSPLGLVEMTRQNVTDGVREILTKRCPTCEGEGVVESEETVAIDVVRRLRDLVEASPDGPEAYLVRVNPKVAAELLHEDSALHQLEESSVKHFHFEGGDALPLDTFEVVDRGTRAEIAKRALPFQVGEEVLVRIEEPHMYNVDDAVARVDSYIVSITGGGPFVGDRRLVRIESVDRSAAIASLVEAAGGGANGSEGDGGEQVESPAGKRRRANANNQSRLTIKPLKTEATSWHVLPHCLRGLMARVRQDTKLYLALTWKQGNVCTFRLTNQNGSLRVEKMLHFHVTSKPSELARGQRAERFRHCDPRQL